MQCQQGQNWARVRVGVRVRAQVAVQAPVARQRDTAEPRSTPTAWLPWLHPTLGQFGLRTL